MKDIIIVEDGQKDRERLKKLFTDAGYSVVACDSASAAERELKLNTFRLAILDIGLSDKSGSYLFSTIKRMGRASYIMIVTGNPSMHLKQRFLDEGAVDYIVKATPQAQSSQLLSRVKEIIGPAQKQSLEGIPLDYFLEKYVDSKSKQLFLDMDDSFPVCKGCGSKDYIVVFSGRPQLPPDITGTVVCVGCGNPMNPEVE